MKYDFKQVEQKWQKIWDEEHTFAAKQDYTLPKYYALVEFPYPSGQGLHVGHPRSYTALDIVAVSYTHLIPQGDVDVVVCDGFTGNVILKLTEGLAKMLVGQIKGVFLKNALTKLAFLFVKDGMKDFKKKLDADEYGGALMMGVQHPVIKAHGSSNAKAFKNAIRQAKACVEGNAVNTMAEKLALTVPDGTEG